ncbi:MAG: NUDIX hydrolase [Candidatus Vogelbacteria bacterium]|nr:NUDIX hydrolase [Candidatus Vogelbacteria bacterium]
MAWLTPEEYYRGLPKKRIGAGVLFLNEEKKVLIVAPTYKEGWTIPGGVVDANESPIAGAIRETKEEIGLSIKDPRLICVGYVPVNGYKTEALHFIFYGGVLNGESIAQIKLQEEELGEYRFADKDELARLLIAGLNERVLSCLDVIDTGETVYHETVHSLPIS